jgi:photosystem II stability/assembly factor-like uncharacterized protein
VQEEPPTPDVWLDYKTGVNPGSAIQFVTPTDGWQLGGQGSNPHLDGALAAGPNGAILGWPGDSVGRSTDGGKSWTEVLNDGNGLWGIDALSEDEAWAVGVLSLYRTEDGGATWQVMGEPERERLVTVDFVTPNRGFGITTSGAVVLSSDGGVTWAATGFAEGATSLCFTQDSVGYLADGSGDIYSTADSGKNWNRTAEAPIKRGQDIDLRPYWTQLACADRDVWESITVPDPLLGGHSGNPYVIAHSSDAGETWSLDAALSGGKGAATPSAPSPVGNLAAVAPGPSGGFVLIGFPDTGWRLDAAILAGDGQASDSAILSLPSSDESLAARDYVAIHGVSFVGTNGWILLTDNALGTMNNPQTQTIVLATTDGGRSWTVQNSGQPEDPPRIILQSPSAEPESGSSIQST